MHVSWIAHTLLPLPGRLGLCALSGSASAPRDVDLAALAAQGVDLLICLVEDHELARLDPPESPSDRAAAVQAHGMRFLHVPIEDFTAPSVQEADALTQCILTALTDGRAVVVHCHAGLGRAGTVAACALLARGMSAADAIAAVRWVRPGAIQSQAQEDLLHARAHR